MLDGLGSAVIDYGSRTVDIGALWIFGEALPDAEILGASKVNRDDTIIFTDPLSNAAGYRR